MTGRPARSTVAPSRASSYSRRPSWCTALYMGGTWVMGPVRRAAPAVMSASEGGTPREGGSEGGWSGRKECVTRVSWSSLGKTALQLCVALL